MTSRLPSRWGPSQILAAGLGHLDDAKIEIDASIDDMLCTLLIPDLLAATPATALPAFVQSTPTASEETAPAPSSTTPTTAQTAGTLDQRLERWGRVLDRVRQQLEEQELSLAVLSRLEATTDKVRNQLDAARGPLRSEADGLRALFDALGPPRNEGAPPEAVNNAAQRRELNQQLALPEGQLGEFDVLIQRANLLANAIVEAEGSVRRAGLLVCTPALLSSETWAKAATEFVALAKRILVVAVAYGPLTLAAIVRIDRLIAPPFHALEPSVKHARPGPSRRRRTRRPRARFCRSAAAGGATIFQRMETANLETDQFSDVSENHIMVRICRPALPRYPSGANILSPCDGPSDCLRTRRLGPVPDRGDGTGLAAA